MSSGICVVQIHPANIFQVTQIMIIRLSLGNMLYLYAMQIVLIRDLSALEDAYHEYASLIYPMFECFPCCGWKKHPIGDCT